MQRLAFSRFFLPFLVLGFGLTPGDCFAASWSWGEAAAGRDRIMLELDNPQQRVSINRTGPQSLEIAISPAPETLTQTGNAVNGNLAGGFAALDEQGRAVLDLQNPAFGYILTQSAPGRFVVDVYPDPLGARWQPGGGLGPVQQPQETTAAPAVQTPPAALAPAQERPPAQAQPPAQPPVQTQVSPAAQVQPPVQQSQAQQQTQTQPIQTPAQTVTTPQNQQAVPPPAVEVETQPASPIPPATTAPADNQILPVNPAQTVSPASPQASPVVPQTPPQTPTPVAQETPVVNTLPQTTSPEVAPSPSPAPLTGQSGVLTTDQTATQPVTAQPSSQSLGQSLGQSLAQPLAQPTGQPAGLAETQAGQPVPQGGTVPVVEQGERLPLNSAPPVGQPVPNYSSASGAATASPVLPPADTLAQTPPVSSGASASPAVPAQTAPPPSPSPQTAPQPTPSPILSPTAQPVTQTPAQPVVPQNQTVTTEGGAPRVRLNSGGKEQAVEYNLTPVAEPSGQSTGGQRVVLSVSPTTPDSAQNIPQNQMPVSSGSGQTGQPTQPTQPTQLGQSGQTGQAGQTGQIGQGPITQTVPNTQTGPLQNPPLTSPPPPGQNPAQNLPPADGLPPIINPGTGQVSQQPANSNAPAGSSQAEQQMPQVPPVSPEPQVTSTPPVSSAQPPQSPQSPQLPQSQGQAAQPEQPGQTAPPVSSATSSVTPSAQAADLPAENQAPAPLPAVTSAKPEGAPIVFVDEAGNPIPPPADVQALVKNAREMIGQGNYLGALSVLEQLRDMVKEPVLKEEVLYMLMDARLEAGRPDYSGPGVAEGIIQAANEAMNFNLDSPRVPSALTTLAHVNTRIGHLEDAHGYVFLMYKNYPQNSMLPVLLSQLAYKYAENGRYAEAIDVARIVTQEFPNSDQAKEAARLVAYSYYKQGLYDKALEFIEFIDRRWPNIYLDFPDYLQMSADMRFAQGKLPEALTTYWLEYNLNPLLPASAGVLLRIAEIYYMMGDDANARIVLDTLLKNFPDSNEAPEALLWEGEGAMYPEKLTLDEILAIFDRPNPRIPSFSYQRIINEYPDAPITPVAQLRLIAWQLWNGEYEKAMEQARSYTIDYAGKPESLQAMEVLLRAFAHELGIALSEENYDRVLSLWERYPQVHAFYNPMEDDIRVALARANLNRGNEEQGLELLAPFLEGPENAKYGQYAYNIYLASYLRTSNWGGILTLGDKVANWDFPEDMRDQLDYAMALSAENLGLPAKSLPLWQKLAPKENIPLYQRAYATYFLARDAEARQDLRAAYQYNLDALAMFKDLENEGSPYASPERQRESIAALMEVTEIAGRFAEALEWAGEYARFVPITSPDYAGLRFREARLYRKIGDLARWRSILETIISTEPDSVFGKMAASELRTFDVARDLQRFTE